jgi:hypothetical protein
MAWIKASGVLAIRKTVATIRYRRWFLASSSCSSPYYSQSKPAKESQNRRIHTSVRFKTGVIDILVDRRVGKNLSY